MPPRYHVLSDFDGTITRGDLCYRILEEFAAPGWVDAEKAYRLGEIGSEETVRRQFGLVKASESEIRELVARELEIDPGFVPFCRYLKEREIPLAIVSEGFDFMIEMALETLGMPKIPYYSHKVAFKDCGMAIDFPHAEPDCPGCGTCGLCKPEFVRLARAGGFQVVCIGDGFTDQHMAKEADVVFAKDELAKICRKREIEHVPYQGFGDIEEWFKKHI